MLLRLSLWKPGAPRQQACSLPLTQGTPQKKPIEVKKKEEEKERKTVMH